MDLIASGKDKMQKAVEHLKQEFSKLRTGRANPTLVEHVRVDYYGTPTPLNQMAQVSIPDPKTIQITSWDQSAIPLIEKAIIGANIGLTPNVDGKIIRLNVPPLTEERRKDIAKTVKKVGEDAKVQIRKARQEANDEIKAKEKSKEFSEDESKRKQGDVQKLTDQFTAEIDKLVDSKTKDVMTV